MGDNSESFYSELHASLNEASVEISQLDPAKVQQLLKDKTKARQYIKNCKTILKKQSEQLKTQQREFKKSVSSLETQSFTTKFHAVAFKLEHEVMKLVGIRRRIDTAILKQYFNKFATKAQARRLYNNSVAQIRSVELKSACLVVWSAFKKRQERKIVHAFQRIRHSESKTELLKQTYNRLLSEKQLVLQQASSAEGALEQLVQENKKLKEKLHHSEQSVALFIKEMSGLLDKNEPGALLAENASPKHPPKKRGKTKNRNSLVSGDKKYM